MSCINQKTSFPKKSVTLAAGMIAKALASFKLFGLRLELALPTLVIRHQFLLNDAINSKSDLTKTSTPKFKSY